MNNCHVGDEVTARPGNACHQPPRTTSVEGAGGRRGLVSHKSRMQFDWAKIQQSLKTLQFHRCKFMV